MIIDSSALIAIAFGEPESDEFLQHLQASPVAKISAATYLETSIVLLQSSNDSTRDFLDDLLERFRITVVPVDDEQARLAAEAYATYGQGRHPARLNFGDCFTYALAKQTGEPLLFKGEDFTHTDLESA